MARFNRPSHSSLKWSRRAARCADANNLATIDAAASILPWSESQFIEACDSGSTSRHNAFSERVLLLESEGETCGFIVDSLVAGEGSILSIVVHPSWQGQGGARGLMQWVLDLLGKKGAHRCLLEVRASNTVARRLYDSFGFQRDGIRPNYYPSARGREDALLMSKSLIPETDKRMPQ